MIFCNTNYEIGCAHFDVQSLLCDPNPASPANSEAAKLYAENRTEYNRRVHDIVVASCIATESDGEEDEEEGDGEDDTAEGTTGVAAKSSETVDADTKTVD